MNFTNYFKLAHLMNNYQTCAVLYHMTCRHTYYTRKKEINLPVNASIINGLKGVVFIISLFIHITNSLKVYRMIIEIK